jgi:hypothetical protein
MMTMNVNANMDNLEDCVGKSDILEYRNPPIPSRHVSNLTISNFDTYRHRLTKFQCWPHSLLTMWGRCMTFVMGVILEVPCQISR